MQTRPRKGSIQIDPEILSRLLVKLLTTVTRALGISRAIYICNNTQKKSTARDDIGKSLSKKMSHFFYNSGSYRLPTLIKPEERLIAG